MISFGTTVIAVAFNRSIFVAVDSLTYDNRGAPGIACKMGVIGNTAYAVAGSLQHTQDGWAALEIAREVASLDLLPKDVSDEYVRRIAERGGKSFDRLRETNPALFSSLCGTAQFNALFAKCGPTGHLVVVRLTPTFSAERGLIFKREGLVTTSRDDGAWVALGHTNQVSKYIHTHPGYFFSEDAIPRQLTELIGLEAKANPGKVGGKIAMLKVGPSDIEWLMRGACAVA